MRNSKLLLVAGLVAILIFALPAIALADAGGLETYETAEVPTAVAIDFIWLLVAAFLVFLMQAGFAAVEAGFCRAKNTTNLMMKNMMDMADGFARVLRRGLGDHVRRRLAGFIGTDQWFLLGDAYDVTVYRDFMFQVVFAATAATIVSGAVAERLKFGAYLVYSVVITALIYPIYGHWVWGGGWLANLPFGDGHVDFAGSGVVHAVGGFVGLAGAHGPRPALRQVRQGRQAPRHPGSQHRARHDRPVHPVVRLVRLQPGLHALRQRPSHGQSSPSTPTWPLRPAPLVALLDHQVQDRHLGRRHGHQRRARGPGGHHRSLCVRRGLRSHRHRCHRRLRSSSCSVYALENMGIDDPVGAVSVHGVNGIWGLIAVGLFADGTYTAWPVTGLFYGGGTGQLIAQLIGAVTVFAWAFGTGFILFKVMDLVVGIRVSPEEELAGLDVMEHGSSAYPNFLTVEE